MVLKRYDGTVNVDAGDATVKFSDIEETAVMWVQLWVKL